MYLSLVAAHEMGHSMGLVADGAPPAGLFGNAHPSNTFVASAAYTSSGHLDTAEVARKLEPALLCCKS